jgi:hypothetical protein
MDLFSCTEAWPKNSARLAMVCGALRKHDSNCAIFAAPVRCFSQKFLLISKNRLFKNRPTHRGQTAAAGKNKKLFTKFPTFC